jgi:predicted DNA-binding transcriptional regulator AlpA
MRNGQVPGGNKKVTLPNISTGHRGPERLAVSIKEFTQMFGLSLSMGYTLVNEGRVPVVDFGSRIVIPMKWINEQLEQAKPRNAVPEE